MKKLRVIVTAVALMACLCICAFGLIACIPNFGKSENSENTDSGAGTGTDSNDHGPQSRTVAIYKEYSPYKPTGTVDEQLLTSKLLVDLTGIIGKGFKGSLTLQFSVDLAYSQDFGTPAPTFTFYYYSKNEVNPEYLIGQNTVTVLSKTMKTYKFSITFHNLNSGIIYGARACNLDMGRDGTNILGMYMDRRTYSLNNYYATFLY